MTLSLGTQTGSLINHLYSRMTKGQPAPVVGMGATFLLFTDRHAATIVQIHDAREDRWLIEVQEDRATVIKGSTYDGSAEYSYQRDSSGARYFFRFDPKHGWRQVRRNDKGRWVLFGGYGLRIGQRQEYRDPHF